MSQLAFVVSKPKLCSQQLCTGSSVSFGQLFRHGCLIARKRPCSAPSRVAAQRVSFFQGVRANDSYLCRARQLLRIERPAVPHTEGVQPEACDLLVFLSFLGICSSSLPAHKMAFRFTILHRFLPCMRTLERVLLHVQVSPSCCPHVCLHVSVTRTAPLFNLDV